MGWKYAEDRRAYHRAYMRERRAWLKKHHLCTECKKEDAFTMVGRRLCADCAERKRKTPRELIPIEKKRVPKIPRWERSKNGLCYLCGAKIGEYKQKINDSPRICQKCYEKLLPVYRSNGLAVKESGWNYRKRSG